MAGPLIQRQQEEVVRRGLLMIPIAQLDLAVLANLMRLQLGTGLLQLWPEATRMLTLPLGVDGLPANVPTLIPDVTLERYHFEAEHSGVPLF